jgi:hypothetical protein
MDIYEQIVNCFSDIPNASLWEDAQSLFRRIAAGRPEHWLLPVQACEAGSGTPVWKLFEALGETPPDLPTLRE